MILKYVYKDKEYGSAWAVRQAISEAENVAFGEEPKEGRAEFWAELGVTYTEEPDPEPDLESVRASKLGELERAFMSWYEYGAVCTSSLGFVADADSRAMMDVNGLVTAAEGGLTRGAVAFMDHDNVPHDLTAEQLKVVQMEIIANGQDAYRQKWELRTAIQAAETAEAINAVEINFIGMDFTKGEVDETP